MRRFNFSHQKIFLLAEGGESKKNCKVTSVHDCREKFRSIWTVTESSALQLLFILAKTDNESEGNTFPNVRGKCDENYRRLNAIIEVNWEEFLSRTRLLLSDVGNSREEIARDLCMCLQLWKLRRKKRKSSKQKEFSLFLRIPAMFMFPQ